MDDQHTHKTLDELADLFLTSTEPAPLTGGGTMGAPWGGVAVSDYAGQPHRQSQAPPAIRLAPKPARAPALPEVSQEADVVGIIGRENDSFSGAALASPHPPVHPRGRTQMQLVEAVFMGNLPGFAAPWLTQYAHRLAQRHGPVAVLHVNDEQIELEVVTIVGSTLPLPLLDSHRDRLEAEDHNDKLLDCLHDLSKLTPIQVKTWLIHLPVPPSPGTIAKALQIPRWTILSGADDAAAAAAYRLLNQLLDSDRHATRRRIGLMVMGSDKEASRTAAHKLNAAAADLLQTPVGLVGFCKQMVPVNRQTIGRFAGGRKLWTGVQAMIETMHGQLLHVEADDHIEPPSIQGKPPVPPPDLELPPALPPTPTPDYTKSTPPHPEVEQTEEVAASCQELDLAGYLPGVIRLQARYPRLADSQLALDQQGRLHLLYHVLGGVHEAQSLRAVILDMLEARTWAIEHLELLAMTQRQCRFDSAVEPSLHLFTDHAKAAAVLASSRLPLVNLHLLQQIKVADQHHIWHCTDLN